MSIRITQFLAVILTVLSLVPGGAHLLEFPAKAKLDAQAYMTVQQIYSGWAFAGIVIFGAIAANFWLAVRSRSQPMPFALACCAAGLIVITLVTFFIWIYPVNQATANWTAMPEHLPPLRAQWERTHAINAVLTFLAVIATLVASLGWRPATPHG
jgi:membrane protease YdiL (CAAX protease family)